MYYKTYLAAIRQFDQLISQGSAAENKNQLIEVSGVVLLVNPSHATCLNKRRALIEEGLLSAKEELSTIASLQLLHESSKSSILWSYRRWLLRKLYGPADESLGDSLEGVNVPLEGLSQELDIATTASEIYPRNYHAWLHRYKCLDSLASSNRSSNPTALLSQVLRAEEFAITKWVEMHVGDYSAMQYLCHVYATMAKMGIQHIQMHADDGVETGSDVQVKTYPFSPWEHAVELVQRYPTHEALWHYLRTSYALQDGAKDSEMLPKRQEPYTTNFERWKVGFEDRKAT